MGESSVLWRCRRGIREMDLLLQRFVERYYPDLPATERQHFSDLLDEADLDIMDWILQRSEAPANYQAILEKIRAGNQPIKPDSN